MAGPDSPAEKPLPVNIILLIEELRRSVIELNARAASVPEIHKYYLPQAAPALAVPAPVQAPAVEPVTVYVREQAGQADKRQEPVELSRIAPAKPAQAIDNDIIRSNVVLGRLREDFVGLTYDLAEVERLINEAMRSPAADIPAMVSAKVTPIMPSQQAGGEYVERPAPEVIVREKTSIVKEVVTKEGARESKAGQDDAKVSKPAVLATALAQGISLPGVIRKSTVEMMIMQAALAPEPARYLAVPVAPESRSAIVQDAVPDIVSSKIPAPQAPVVQALGIARAFNALIDSYLSFRGTPARRGDIKDGVTQLLLSLPEQKAVEGPASGLFEAMAALQAAGPKAAGMLQPVEIAARAPATAAAPLTQDNEPMRSTVLGDLGEMHNTMAALQDAVGSLRRASPPVAEVPEAAGIPAAEWPEYEGELSVIRASIARLQAAMNYLSVNVPTLADLVVIQRSVVDVPPLAAAAPQAAAPVAVTIEGVQPKAAAPVSLPDLSWVTREFGQMQGMIARLQVPMYAEGGLVEEPTLAFVGESEPEWIVPMSAWDASQSKLNDFYHMLWSQIQDLGTSMQDTVDGVNEALEGITPGGEGKSEDTDLRQQLQDTMKELVDRYLGMIGLSVDTLKDAEKTAGMGLVLGTATVALPYAKKVMVGDDEEDKEESSGGGKEDDKEEDDEEDFWEMIDGLDEAASISDKRDGKFDPDEK